MYIVLLMLRKKHTQMNHLFFLFCLCQVLPSPPSCPLCMVMFCCCYPSSTSALLLVLLSLTPLLALAAPALQQRSSVSSSINEALNLAKEDPGTAEGAARTRRKVDSLLQKPLGQEHVSDMASASSLASVLLEALDHPVREKMTQGDLKKDSR